MAFESPWGDILLLVSFSFTLLYLLARYQYGYWKRKGIHSPEASFPWGHFGKVLSGNEHVGVHLSNMYHQTKSYPYIGLFMIYSKALMINDLDMVRNILVKDFQHFTDHGLGVSDADPLGLHLFNMEGVAWKNMRAKLTPTFTSSKMKYMFNTILECSKQVENYLEQQVIQGKDVDFREVVARYGTDVIGSCAFGIDTNSFKHPDAEFRKMGKKIFRIDRLKSIRDAMTLIAPFFIKTFKIRTIDRDVEDFLVKCVTDTIKYREENNISKNDFLQMLIEMKKSEESSGNGKSITLIEIVSQVFLFFAAGFETSSTATGYALYELAKNHEIQDKVRKEIDTVLEKHGGKITYEAITEMQYLTQVIEESLRMYPPLPMLFRVCTKDYTLPNTDVVIKEGTRVIIPIFGIHRDPKVHPEPNVFKPERFSPENKGSLHPLSNLAFGEGPRLCIGNRFGMMQSRLGIISTLSKFKVELSQKENRTVNFTKNAFLLFPDKNPLFRVSRRNDT